MSSTLIGLSIVSILVGLVLIAFIIEGVLNYLEGKDLL